jgi:hypothetical protein
MTLGNMRANGVRSLDVCWWLCDRQCHRLGPWCAPPAGSSALGDRVILRRSKSIFGRSRASDSVISFTPPIHQPDAAIPRG